MTLWRYAQADQPSPPLDTDALATLFRNGSLPPTTLVWKDGMAAWAAASMVPEFVMCFPTGSAPPPIPPAGAPPVMGAAPLSEAADIEQNKVFAVLAYLGILFLVPLLAAPQSKFARYHANQGVVLFLASFVAVFGCMIVMVIPFVGFLAIPVLFFVVIAPLVLTILGIINALSGQFKPLPIIGHFQLVK